MAREYQNINGVKHLLCSMCKTPKPLTPEFFKPAKGQLDNCRACCRECESVSARAYNKKWRERRFGKPKEPELLGPSLAMNPVVLSVCPKCGKKHKISKTFPYTGKIPAKFLCDMCIRKEKAVKAYVRKEYMCEVER